MIYQAKKIWEGKVSVRSYLVAYCKRNRENLIIKYQGGKMTVEYYDLDRYTTDGIKYVTKISDQYIAKGKKYILCDYKWQIDPEPVSWTKEGADKLISAWRNISYKFKK